MSDTVIGGCLCGELRFSAPAEPILHVLCHCTNCQPVSGAARYTAYIAPFKTFQRLKVQVKPRIRINPPRIIPVNC